MPLKLFFDLEEQGFWSETNPLNYSVFYLESLDTRKISGNLYYPTSDEIYNKCEGNFVSKNFNGRCKLYMKNGANYDGNFQNGFENFKGTYRPDSGVSDITYLLCEMVHQKIEGDVKVLYKNMDVYQGTLENFVADGFGQYYYSNDNDKYLHYKGEFHEGKIHGTGVMYYKNNCVYEGEWANGKNSGFGIMTFPTGSEYEKYEGNFLNDQFHGNG